MNNSTKLLLSIILALVLVIVYMAGKNSGRVQQIPSQQTVQVKTQEKVVFNNKSSEFPVSSNPMAKDIDGASATEKTILFLFANGSMNRTRFAGHLDRW